jgi:AhpD family alkylhydroperoxidase
MTEARRRFWLRVGLLALGVPQTAIGLWARIAPHDFYATFPGSGHHWVAQLGAYDAHLVTDVGGGLLALGVLVLVAAVVCEYRLVQVALGVWLVFSVSHLIFHLATLEGLSVSDAIGNVATLGFEVILPIGLLVLVQKPTAWSRPAAETPDAGTNARLVPAPAQGLVRRVCYRQTRKRYGRVVTPVGVYAHHPTLLAGYGALELATERSKRLPARLKDLAAMKVAMLVGCEWCLDIGSAIGRESGITDDELRELAVHSQSQRLSDLDKLAVDYAEAITLTPTSVSDELFAQLREHFDEAQLVELTHAIAIENYRARFNWAFGIKADGFSQDDYCVRPQSQVVGTDSSNAIKDQRPNAGR